MKQSNNVDVPLTVDRAHSHAPVVRVDLCQLWNVVCIFAGLVLLGLVVNAAQLLSETEKVRDLGLKRFFAKDKKEKLLGKLARGRAFSF